MQIKQLIVLASAGLASAQILSDITSGIGGVINTVTSGAAGT
jgi:hypothetical protein